MAHLCSQRLVLSSLEQRLPEKKRPSVPGLSPRAEMMVLDKEDGRWAGAVGARAWRLPHAADGDIKSLETDARCAYQSALVSAPEVFPWCG